MTPSIETGVIVAEEGICTIQLKLSISRLIIPMGGRHCVMFRCKSGWAKKAMGPEILVLDGGRVVADGATADILTDASLLAAHGLEE